MQNLTQAIFAQDRQIVTSDINIKMTVAILLKRKLRWTIKSRVTLVD